MFMTLMSGSSSDSTSSFSLMLMNESWMSLVSAWLTISIFYWLLHCSMYFLMKLKNLVLFVEERFLRLSLSDIFPRMSMRKSGDSEVYPFYCI